MAKHITMTNEFKAAFDSFITALQAMVDRHLREHGYQWEEAITFDEGAKFIRVWRGSPSGGKSSHCFIEKNTGAIYKCETWKKPAKHVRGNIFAEDPLGGVTVYGAQYLR